ncbi:MAG: hypothetical protein QXJ74_02510 [Nitrososphaera sp.]|uniref:hypothetical protein n=1 Tax=Nitrososphaera sp. TaxID=1971748 RepID=UPI00184F368F|nr:hypothetical protein [Nitrososphaera sp.]NWG37630.1 hypothetical protein [Nitrososphaera sp.]
MSADVKEVLYSVIDGIGRGKIRAEVSADVSASKRYCEEITEKCVRALGSQTDDETLGTLCEALLHFMLTASLLPSERKVTVNGVEISVVVPSVKSLAKDPSKSLVIQVVKDGTLQRVREAEKVQPVPDNLWVVSARPIDTDHKNYALNGKYSSIISDIRAFLQDKGVSSLKMLHG